MKAPEDRIEAMDEALRRALAALTTHPWKHPHRREVQGLLSYKEATDRMRESVMKQCRVTPRYRS